MRLKVSENRRFLMHEDGTPFFYLADTGWELFHRLNREEAITYLANRAAKGFTVIQAVALAEFDGLTDPNPYGQTPLADNDPTKPNEEYFRYVDWVVDKAAEFGLFTGLLPTWGDKWNAKWAKGPEIFTPENARVYGEWIGKRYADKSVIWILGGDRPIENDTHRAIVTAMASGIRAAVGDRQLITLHPMGGQTSSTPFHAADWLDFNMYQTGHSADRDNWRLIAGDYALTPTKPCLDAEPGYEDHPNGFRIETGYLDAYDCRRSLWWSLCAGACGHTYGCHAIWQFWTPRRNPINFPRLPWYESIHLPGSYQMRIAKDALLARPYFSRIPDQSLIVSDTYDTDLLRPNHIAATRDENGTCALVYSASGQPFTVDLTKLARKSRAAWLDPRNGKTQEIGEVESAGVREFIPPTRGRGNDWVLTLDAV